MLEEVGSNMAKECSSDRIDGLAIKMEGMQTKSRVSCLTSLLSALPLEDVAHLGGSSPK